MKGTDIQRLAKQGHSFAVINPRQYVSKSYRTLYRINRSQVVEARIQSLDVQYRKTYSRGQADPNVWVAAPKEERTKGYLVRYTDEQGNELYYAASSSEFLDTWSSVDGAIKARELQAAEAQRIRDEAQRAQYAEQERRDAIRAGAGQRTRDMLIRGQEQMKIITASMLGESNSLYVNAHTEEKFSDDGSYDAWVTGSVTLSYGDYARLLEKYLEALDEAQ